MRNCQRAGRPIQEPLLKWEWFCPPQCQWVQAPVPSSPVRSQEPEQHSQQCAGNRLTAHSVVFADFRGINGLPRRPSGKEPTCQCRRLRFNAWIKKSPSSRKRQPTPVFLPGASRGQWSLAGYSPQGCRVSAWLSAHTRYKHFRHGQLQATNMSTKIGRGEHSWFLQSGDWMWTLGRTRALFQDLKDIE